MASKAPAHQSEYLYSPAVRATSSATHAVGATQTWDAFMRQSYEQANEVIQAQARTLVQRGNVSAAEARFLVEGQRNALIVQTRNRLSPWGRLYSELLKPSSSLPTLEQLVRQKGSIEAVLARVGSTRSTVNGFAATMRVAGPAAIVIQISLSIVVVARAAPEDRGRVTAGQVGLIAGGTLGGAGGAWAGCAGLSLLVSPSLVLPVVGEITTGGACLVGGIAGAAGAGWLGSLLGERAGTAAYDGVTNFRWTRG